MTNMKPYSRDAAAIHVAGHAAAYYHFYKMHQRKDSELGYLEWVEEDGDRKELRELHNQIKSIHIVQTPRHLCEHKNGWYGSLDIPYGYMSEVYRFAPFSSERTWATFHREVGEAVGREHIFALLAGKVAEEYAVGDEKRVPHACEFSCVSGEGYGDDYALVEKLSATLDYDDESFSGSPVDEQFELLDEWVATPQVQAQIAALAAELLTPTEFQDGEPFSEPTDLKNRSAAATEVSGVNAMTIMDKALASTDS